MFMGCFWSTKILKFKGVATIVSVGILDNELSSYMTIVSVGSLDNELSSYMTIVSVGSLDNELSSYVIRFPCSFFLTNVTFIVSHVVLFVDNI